MNPVRNTRDIKKKSKISNGVKIIIRNLQKKIPVNPKRIKTAVLKVLSSESIKKTGEITVCFVSDRKIRELNSRYLGKRSPTDVLSFNLTSPKDALSLTADIVVSVDTAMRNSKMFNTSSSYELNLYVIHGLLHVLGYNDASAAQSRLMRERESKYVNTQD